MKYFLYNLSTVKLYWFHYYIADSRNKLKHRMSLLFKHMKNVRKQNKMLETKSNFPILISDLSV
jgi:hypothetical protein